MRGIKRNWFKRGMGAAATALLLTAAAIVSYAASPADVLEQRVTENSVLVYVRHGGEEQKVQARVGTESGIRTKVTDREELSVVTWLLVDNSQSIRDGDRETVSQLLTNLVAGRAPNERFNLCTFSDTLTILLEDCQNYTDLKTQIDQLEYRDQETYLTDVLAEVLDRERAREGSEFVRVIVISDGVDNNPGGLTREELTQRLREQALPIYTLGAAGQNNEQNLKEMYALSRQTNGQSWTLRELSDTLDVVQAMGELPICVEVKIPETLRDGAEKGVQLTFSDGSVADTQAVMPFGTGTERPEKPSGSDSAPEPEPAPEPVPDLEPDSDSKLPFALLAIAVLAAAALLIIGVVVFLLLLRKKKKNQIQPVNLNFSPGGGETELDLQDELRSGDTLPLIGSDRCPILSLTDRADPSRRFEAPLRGRISIGRSFANQIVLDYERSVSGTHCEIFAAGTAFQIRDLGSKNGTCVDGIRVGDTAEISCGSVLKLGRLELVVDIR